MTNWEGCYSNGYRQFKLKTPDLQDSENMRPGIQNRSSWIFQIKNLQRQKLWDHQNSARTDNKQPLWLQQHSIHRSRSKLQKTVEKTNRRNEKENKQTNGTEQNRTERRKRKRKTTQQTLKRKKLRTPLRNQKSDFLFCVFSPKPQLQWTNGELHKMFTNCVAEKIFAWIDVQIYRSC